MTEAITSLLGIGVLTSGVVGFRWIMMKERIRKHRITMDTLAGMEPEQIEAMRPKLTLPEDAPF